MTIAVPFAQRDDRHFRLYSLQKIVSRAYLSHDEPASKPLPCTFRSFETIDVSVCSSRRQGVTARKHQSPTRDHGVCICFHCPAFHLFFVNSGSLGPSSSEHASPRSYSPRLCLIVVERAFAQRIFVIVVEVCDGSRFAQFRWVELLSPANPLPTTVFLSTARTGDLCFAAVCRQTCP